METGIKPSVWKDKKLYWYDRETSETERQVEYPPMVRMMVVNGLRDDNTAWYSVAEIRGRVGDFEPKKKLQNAYRTMDMASHYNDEPSAPVTEEQWAAMIEVDRRKLNGTYFDEASIPTSIQNVPASVPSV
jgi:hypothetical protein